MKHRRKTYTLISAKSVFTISLVVLALTVLAVFLWGLGTHRTFYENTMISTTILSMAFFAFITIGLYKGVKLKDDVGKILDSNYRPVMPDVPVSADSFNIDVDPGEGLGGCIVAVLLWIVVAILLAVGIWVFGNMLVFIVFAFMAMLYWVFFRALRLVFKNSNKSKGDLLESMKYAAMYTVLYNFWIYGIFMMTHALKS